MNMVKKTSALLLISLLTSSGECFSQIKDRMSKETQDSIPKRAVAYAADKFAIARPFNVEFTHAASYNYTSKKEGNSLPESRVTNFSQAKVSANFNFIKRKTWLLGATLGYRYTTTDAEVTVPVSNVKQSVENDFHYHFTSLNYVRFSTLFKKRAIYTASILVDGSDKHFERVKGYLTGTLVLKANSRTKMTAGIIVNVDPSSQSPVIPSFSYERKFKNGLIADINLPRSIYLRKYVLKNGRLSLGTELDQTSFYLYNIGSKTQRYEYRQLDINSGINYEHVIAKYFILTAKTGLKLTPNGRIFEKQESFGSPVFEIKPDPTYYFNIGISFNPFSLIGKKK